MVCIRVELLVSVMDLNIGQKEAVKRSISNFFIIKNIWGHFLAVLGSFFGAFWDYLAAFGAFSNPLHRKAETANVERLNELFVLIFFCHLPFLIGIHSFWLLGLGSYEDFFWELIMLIYGNLTYLKNWKISHQPPKNCPPTPI